MLVLADIRRSREKGGRMLKRVALFLVINFVVLLTIGFVVQVFGFDRWMTAEGVDYRSMLAFCAVWGFGGSAISLLMSKSIAKMSVGAQVIRTPANKTEAWLVETVRELADKAGVAMPEVAVYKGSPNAFATGAFKNDALVAVSTGLLQSMTPTQVRAVLAHEMSHVRNGDMVTMTLLQGVLNTFVFFLARVLTIFLANQRDEDGRRRGGAGSYFMIRIFETVFGILASIVACAFSRRREYRADAGAAELTDAADMISALKALGQGEVRPLPAEMRAFGVVDLPSFAELFATHPSLDDRIKALGGTNGGMKKAARKTGGLFASVDDDSTPWH